MKPYRYRATVFIATAVLIGQHASAGLKQVHWAPTELSNTVVWLDAADPDTQWEDTSGMTPATGPVARWDDKSGHSNHMLQADSSYQPVTGSRTISNINAIAFDGNNDMMQEASNAFGSVISNAFAFMVISRDRANSAAEGFLGLSTDEQWSIMTWGWDNPDAMFRLFSGGNSSRIELRSVTNEFQEVTTLLGAYDSVTENRRQIWINGVNRREGTSGGDNTTTDGIMLAKVKENGTTFDGLIAEVIIIDGTVTDEERQTIEGYLAWKWDFVEQLPVDHPYKEEWPNKPPEGMVIILR